MSHTKKPTIEKIILALLGLLALAALVRTMFLGLEIDEEYALSLGFRLVRGDRLFYSMWEPHQLAALPPALLIGLFTAVAGTTTGVLLFVRGAVLVVKLALAVWFYRSLRVALGGRCAYLLALAVLAFTPKWFLGPDYVSQQFHFTLAAFLFTGDDVFKRIGDLSGGERGRVSLAKLMLSEANFLILDEPTNHLDIKYQLEIMDIVKSLDVTVIAAVHDLNIAAMYCDRLIAISGGKVAGIGTPRELLTAEFIKKLYGVDSRVDIEESTGRMNIVYLPRHWKEKTPQVST
mgnify:CR=1 FL=1